MSLGLKKLIDLKIEVDQIENLEEGKIVEVEFKDASPQETAQKAKTTKTTAKKKAATTKKDAVATKTTAKKKSAANTKTDKKSKE